MKKLLIMCAIAALATTTSVYAATTSSTTTTEKANPQKIPLNYLFSFSTGKLKYISGYGSFFRKKCHHSVSIGLKP